MSQRALARSTRTLALLMAALLEIVAPAPARAQQSGTEVDVARAIFIEATKLANQGRWNEARELYTRSLKIKPAAITVYSLGVAQRETGHLADALGSFRAFLAEPGTPTTAPYEAPARAAIAAIEARIGRVVITVEPRAVDGLTLAIDGVPVPATSARPREVDAGVHAVVAAAPGFRGASAGFNVTAGSATTVALTLTPETRSPTLPIALMAAGGAVFFGGLAVGLVGVKEASHATTRDGADAHAARTKGIAGDVMGGAGLVAAGVGLVLLLTQGHASPAAPPATGAVRLSTSGAGAGLELSF